MRKGKGRYQKGQQNCKGKLKGKGKQKGNKRRSVFIRMNTLSLQYTRAKNRLG